MHLKWRQIHVRLVVTASPVVSYGEPVGVEKNIYDLVPVQVRDIQVVARGDDIVVGDIPDFNDFAGDNFGQ